MSIINLPFSRWITENLYADWSVVLNEKKSKPPRLRFECRRRSSIFVIKKVIGQHLLRTAEDMPLVYIADDFKAKESDVVILDLVVRDRICFLRDKGLMTLAFSQARVNFIVVGTQPLLEASRYTLKGFRWTELR